MGDLRLLKNLPGIDKSAALAHFKMEVWSCGIAGTAAGGYHLHYYLDASPPTAAGKPATATVGHWASSAIGSYTWRNVAAGTHILSVQLVRRDDTPLAPAIVDSVTVHAVSSTSQPSLPASTTPRPPSPGS